MSSSDSESQTDNVFYREADSEKERVQHEIDLLTNELENFTDELDLEEESRAKLEADLVRAAIELAELEEKLAKGKQMQQEYDQLREYEAAANKRLAELVKEVDQVRQVLEQDQDKRERDEKKKNELVAEYERVTKELARLEALEKQAL